MGCFSPDRIISFVEFLKDCNYALSPAIDIKTDFFVRLFILSKKLLLNNRFCATQLLVRAEDFAFKQLLL